MTQKKSKTKVNISTYVKDRKFPILISIFYFVITLTLILNRFWQYEAFYYDHGMMEGSAYQVAHFKIPMIDREGRVPVYMDHFSPSMHIVLAPFYWLWDSYETPLIVLAILIGTTPLIAYELGKSLKIKSFMIYALIFAFMFYIGTQNAIIFLIHDVTLQMPFLLLLFLSLVKKKLRLFFILLIINLGFKESFSITGMTLGLGLLFMGSQWRKYAIAALLTSFLWGIAVAYVVVPYFKFVTWGVWGRYQYTPELASPIRMISLFWETPQKIETIITSITTFGFLPLFSPLSLILILQDLAQRFVLQGGTPLRSGLNLYFNANLAAILLFGSFLSLQKLQNKNFYKKIIFLHAVFIMVIVLVFHRFVYHGPFGLLYNKDFLNITKSVKFMDDFVAQIPKKGKIMTQNNLAVRFTHNDLYILSSKRYVEAVQPDVIALDFRPGQNINDYWPLTPEKIEALAQDLKEDPNYRPFISEQYRYIFIKNE